MILNIYKEKDWTSFDVVAKIKGILKTLTKNKKLKVGHAGTLDPLAEGVLLILTGGDTTKQAEIMTLEKEYEAVIGFGVTSPTYDLEGPLNIQPLLAGYDIEKELKGKFDKYLGEIEQIVPPYSAVKIKGKALYKSAREGKMDDIKLPTKTVNIYEIKPLEYKIFKNELGIQIPTVKVLVRCSKGTYVRSLAHDLGEDLGVGGILMSLVRTRVGDYKVEDSMKVAEVEAKLKM